MAGMDWSRVGDTNYRRDAVLLAITGFQCDDGRSKTLSMNPQYGANTPFQCFCLLKPARETGTKKR